MRGFVGEPLSKELRLYWGETLLSSEHLSPDAARRERSRLSKELPGLYVSIGPAAESPPLRAPRPRRWRELRVLTISALLHLALVWALVQTPPKHPPGEQLRPMRWVLTPSNRPPAGRIAFGWLPLRRAPSQIQEGHLGSTLALIPVKAGTRTAPKGPYHSGSDGWLSSLDDLDSPMLARGPLGPKVRELMKGLVAFKAPPKPVFEPVMALLQREDEGSVEGGEIDSPVLSENLYTLTSSATQAPGQLRAPIERHLEALKSCFEAQEEQYAGRVLFEVQIESQRMVSARVMETSPDGPQVHACLIEGLEVIREQEVFLVPQGWYRLDLAWLS